ncbi:MAG: A24 family peptidase [Pseudomonadota bacterium]
MNDDGPVFWSSRKAAAATLALAVVFSVFASVAVVTMTSSTPFLIASAGLAVCLLYLTYEDLRSLLLPDVLTLPLLVAGLIWSTFWGVGPLLSVLGACLGYGLVFALEVYWRRIRRQEGIGLGDAKLLAAGGAWVGALALPIVLLIASGTALVVVLFVAIMLRPEQEMQKVPFGPFLSIGIWTAWSMPALPV